ncbi:phage protein Gp37 [Aquipseudomonas campi]
MLGEMESQLVQLIKDSPLGKRVRTVASLPDTPDKDVIKRWGVEAPAVYVVAMDGSLLDATATPQFVVVMVAQNARGTHSARHGDKKVIGLYEMLDAGIAVLNGGDTEDASWSVTRYELMKDVVLRDAGLQVGLVGTQALCSLPVRDDEAYVGGELGLGDFVEFHADIDLDPPASPGDRTRWLNENHDAPGPDMQSTINPQEVK